MFKKRIVILYLCEKLNLCLINENVHKFNENIENVSNELEYLKLSLLDIKNNTSYKLFHIEDFNVFKKDIRDFINLDFGKDSLGVSKFLIKNQIIKADIEEILNKHLQIKEFEYVNKLISNKLIGFAPSVIYTIDDFNSNIILLNTSNLTEYNSLLHENIN